MSAFFKSIPLALKNDSGDFQGISVASEEWFGYQAGIKVVESFANKSSRYNGSVAANATSSTSIGSFTDTFYNEAIGTHPASALSTGSTTTTIYQLDDSAAIPYNDLPIAADSSGNLHQMSNVAFLRWSTRVAEELHSNEYPGLSFRVATSAPSGDWKKWDSDVFSDTLTNGTANTYSIWRRETAVEPSSPTYNIIEIKSTSPMAVQEFTDSDQKISLRQSVLYARKHSGVGDYLLLPSSQTPTGNGETGTWVARGTALDTRNTLSEQQYTGDFAGSRNYAASYAGSRVVEQDFAGSRNYSSAYSGSRTYSGAYSGSRTYSSVVGQYGGSRNYASVVGQYDGSRNYSAQYAGDRTVAQDFAGSRNYSAQYAGDRTVAQDFAGSRNYGPAAYSGSRNYASVVGQYGGSRNYAGVYGGSRNYAASYAGTRPAVYAGTRENVVLTYYANNFGGSRNYTANFAGTIVQNFISPNVQYSVSYTGSYAGVRNFAGTRVVPQNFAGVTNYLGSRSFTRGYNANFSVTFDSGGKNPSVSVDNFSGVRKYDGVGPANFSGPANFAGTRVVPVAGPAEPGTFDATVVRVENFLGGRSFQGVRPNNFAGSRNYAGTYAGERLGPLVVVTPGNFTGNNPANFDGSRNYASVVGQYGGSRNYAAAYSGSRNYASVTGQYDGTRNYSAQYAGTRVVAQDFAGSRNYSSAYSGSRTYSGAYSGSRTYASVVDQYGGSRNYASVVGQYDGSRNYSAQYTGQRTFISAIGYSGSRNYSDTYSSQFAGQTLVAATETIETYTLYCRVSET